MIYQTYIPGYPLNKFVNQLTYYRNMSAGHSFERYLPNGNVEIVFDLTNTTKYIYDNSSLAQIQALKKVWISGLRNEFITIPAGTGAEMAIVEFRKGMAYPFLDSPLSEISGKVVEGSLILDRVYLELREVLLCQNSVMDIFMAIERMLLKRFSGRLLVNPFVDFAVKAIVATPEGATIKHIANKTGYSAKHFIKIFRENVGATPKSFLKIIRFQRAIREMELSGRINWASLALDCGYYDQSHFITDFKSFSGLTPHAYMKKKGNALNYIALD